jgi:hypothetical protein
MRGFGHSSEVGFFIGIREGVSFAVSGIQTTNGSISYRGKTGKTTGYYVPHYAEAQIRQGVDAWSQLQDCLRELAALNKERLIPAKAKK